MKPKKKGAIDAMGVVVLAVSILIGIYILGSVYNSTSTGTGLPAATTQTLEDTLDNGTTGMTLLGVGLIVMAAVGILSVMGGRD